MPTRYNVQRPSMSSPNSIHRSSHGTRAVGSDAGSDAARADGPARPFSRCPRWLVLALLLPLAFILTTGRALAASSSPAVAQGALASADLPLCKMSEAELADPTSADAPAACAAVEDSEAADAGLSDAGPSDAARSAPMCDNAAASIAAVPEVPEVDHGQFEPARCDVQHLLALLRSDDRAGSANVISGTGEEKPVPPPIRLEQERRDAACSGGQPWPVLSAPSIVAFDAPCGLGWQRGHSIRIDRPPSQR
jgi:hypothetical protein